MTTHCKKYEVKGIGKMLYMLRGWGEEESQDGDQDLEFTDAEVNLFKCRFQEGYDLDHDHDE